MTPCAVILAGGRGTRSADPNTPKISHLIGGKSLLQWQFDLIQDTSIDTVFVVTGFLGDEVKVLCDSADSTGLNVHVIHEQAPSGTVNALKLVLSHTEHRQFLVLLGDVLSLFPVAEFFSAFSESGKNTGVVVHPSTHPNDSDTVFASHSGAVRVYPKGTPSKFTPNMASAGVFAVARDALTLYAKAQDIGSDLLLMASHENDLFIMNSSFYFKDTGTHERLQSARLDYDGGAARRRGSNTSRPGLLLDRDGVINSVTPEVYLAEDYQVLPGVGEAIREVNSIGIPVMVVTNQPGIAKGYMTFEEHERIRAAMDEQLGNKGAFVDDYFFCPHHPDGGFENEIAELKINCECRKPAPGMALDLARSHKIDLTKSVLIGDTARDQGLAEQVGAKFLHVTTDCSLAEKHECFDSTPLAIESALVILS